MIDDLIELREKFNNIKEMGWVESQRKGTTGIGYTFEKLLGKEEEQFAIPDYNTIEIKTRFRNSKENINLFTAAPDGDFLFATKRIYNLYGYPDKQNPEYRVFFAKIGNTPRYAGKKNQFKLTIDRKKELIRIIAIDRDKKNIDTCTSWSFKLLKEKLENKLKYLAFIKADTKFNNNLQFFKYYQLTFYMLRSFDTFLNLLENDVIFITFMIGVYKSGEKKGLMNNHGVRFDISENNLEKLFIKVC